MPGELSPIDKAKFVAAKRAVDFVEDGMRVGLGTGSTAAWMVRCLGELVRAGRAQDQGRAHIDPHGGSWPARSGSR